MKFSRDWLSDYLDLTDLSDEQLSDRFTGIGHAVESIDQHGDDTIFDLEIGTNRVDAMSHLGMARELGTALGRELTHVARPEAGGSSASPAEAGATSGAASVPIRIDVPEMCRRYTGLVICGVTIKPSTEHVRRRLEAVGLRPINNVVDVTNYVMMAVGHPLHAFDLDLVTGPAIVVRRGNPGERIKCLDGEMRQADAETVVIADGKRGVALGGIIGGAETEISDKTRNVLLECASFTPAVIRRTARRLGLKTDASYRFERGVDPNDTLSAIDFAASLVVEYAGGRREPPIDVVAVPTIPRTLHIRSGRLKEASGGVVGDGYALDVFRRLGFGARATRDSIEVIVPTYRGDIHEEMDLVEEVLRFYGYNKIPASLPRVTTGDARPNVMGEAEDEVRGVLVGCGLTEVVNYSFIRAEHNQVFSDERPVDITNALSENITSMRLSLVPGLLETVVHNRSYGVRDGALFEVGRTYHRHGDDAVREHHRLGLIMFGSVGSHWGDAKRPVDFYDIKGIVEQIAARRHLSLTFAPSETGWLKQGRRAVGRLGDRTVATIGFLSAEVLQGFGIKGDVAMAEVDLEALVSAAFAWKMAPVARFPGVPMILALTHGLDLPYERVIETIRSLDVPHLHEVGLRDRFTADNADVIKTTLGMWYQAFDRSLTQDEVGQIHQRLAARVADLLPITLVTQEKL